MAQYKTTKCGAQDGVYRAKRSSWRRGLDEDFPIRDWGDVRQADALHTFPLVREKAEVAEEVESKSSI